MISSINLTDTQTELKLCKNVIYLVALFFISNSIKIQSYLEQKMGYSVDISQKTDEYSIFTNKRFFSSRRKICLYLIKSKILFVIKKWLIIKIPFFLQESIISCQKNMEEIKYKIYVSSDNIRGPWPFFVLGLNAKMVKITWWIIIEIRNYIREHFSWICGIWNFVALGILCNHKERSRHY